MACAAVRTFSCKGDLVNFFGKYAVFATTGEWWNHIAALVPLAVVGVRCEEAVAGHCIFVWRESVPGNESCRVHVKIVNQLATRRQASALLANEGEENAKRWCHVKDVSHWLAVQLEVFDLVEAFGPLGENEAGVEDDPDVEK